MLENLPSFLTHWDDGEITLIGRRVNLYTIIRRHKQGKDAQEIGEDLDIPKEEIEAILGFYHDRQADVDDYFNDYKATLDRQYEEWKNSPQGRRGPTREELLRRLAERGHTLHVDLGPEFDRPL